MHRHGCVVQRVAVDQRPGGILALLHASTAGLVPQITCLMSPSISVVIEIGNALRRAADDAPRHTCLRSEAVNNAISRISSLCTAEFLSPRGLPHADLKHGNGIHGHDSAATSWALAMQLHTATHHAYLECFMFQRAACPLPSTQSHEDCTAYPHQANLAT